METLKYLAGYSPHVQAQVRTLIAQGQLGAMLSDKYGQAHTVRNDGVSDRPNGAIPGSA